MTAKRYAPPKDGLKPWVREPTCAPRCETNDYGACHCTTPCEICGASGRPVMWRGWHDEGSPMLTCAVCEPGPQTKEQT